MGKLKKSAVLIFRRMLISYESSLAAEGLLEPAEQIAALGIFAICTTTISAICYRSLAHSGKRGVRSCSASYSFEDFLAMIVAPLDRMRYWPLRKT